MGVMRHGRFALSLVQLKCYMFVGRFRPHVYKKQRKPVTSACYAVANKAVFRVYLLASLVII